MKGLIIWIRTEAGSKESILDELGSEIEDRGGKVEVFHSETIANLGMEENERAKAAACAMLANHGVIVIASGSESPGITAGKNFEIREIDESELCRTDAHDTFMRELELAGLVPPPKYDVHPDEEEEILKKLKDLGYLDDDSTPGT
ncbi:MAG: hypothetical protein KAW14_00790 [Candidatus Aegiribacteria sp.]|nr:hypothetical protein [Candidatus Aegiribacteria sp.]